MNLTYISGALNWFFISQNDVQWIIIKVFRLHNVGLVGNLQKFLWVFWCMIIFTFFIHRCCNEKKLIASVGGCWVLNTVYLRSLAEFRHHRLEQLKRAGMDRGHNEGWPIAGHAWCRIHPNLSIGSSKRQRVDRLRLRNRNVRLQRNVKLFFHTSKLNEFPRTNKNLDP